MARAEDTSRIIKNANFNWPSVERKEYQQQSHRPTFCGVARYELAGKSAGDHELNFETRYFEMEPGGYTSLEYHRHPHTVVIVRGKGKIILENSVKDFELHDVIYIVPNTLHQFHADADQTTGFICTVDRYRDRPVRPDSDEIKARITDPEVLKVAEW